MQDISIFTAAMKKEFLYGQLYVAEPAPYRNFTTEFPSTARFENYPWMKPAPRMQRYMGKRRWTTIEPAKYTVQNLEFSNELSVPLREIEDDQAGGYNLQIRNMSIESGEPFRSKLVMRTLANGFNINCWDGSPMFATSHNEGNANAAPLGFTGGGNLLGFVSSASSDAVVHTFTIMLQKNPIVKPFFFQNRKPPRFETDSGTPGSKKAKNIDFWIDAECAVAPSFWYDAIMVQILNTPSIIDLQNCLDASMKAIMGFQLPQNLPDDPVERVHEQFSFNEKNATLVCSTSLYPLFRHVLMGQQYGVNVAGSTAGFESVNIYRGLCSLAHTGFLDGLTKQV